MYIKQVIIQGFKSYKEQTVIEPFSPKHNVIVGRNGSGKSNFFAAIRFVLGDAYTQMNREERHALLHEGAAAAVMSAFVEIVFDNSDDRFPTGKSELILRRTIGMKKDEYSLDRKSATKSDVMNLLESAGFSRANPYYIVPQGRVTALTNMKDGERLTLLKEVAGTQVYEARRHESLKIMTETKNKREKIDELLTYINDRLAELEEEKEELRDFQDKDKERRCLQYTIDNREQEAITAELDNLDEVRQEGLDDSEERSELFVQGERKLAELEEQTNRLRQEIEFLRIDKRQLEDERREAARDQAHLDLEAKKQADGQVNQAAQRKRRAEELEGLQKKIRTHQAKLADILPKYTAAVDAETSAKTELDQAEATRQHLYEKQGRNARFRNRKERDDWLQDQISSNKPQLSRLRASLESLTTEAKSLEDRLAASATAASEAKSQLDSRGTEIATYEATLASTKQSRDTLMDRRKDLWREDARLDSLHQNISSDLRAAEKALSHTMNQDTSRGLAAVRRIKTAQNLSGVHGTLADLMTVDPRFQRAVEVTAGQSLFHYVVDTDATATLLIETLQRDRLGRVTFIPLNRLQSRRSTMPQSTDAIPMMTKIRFDPAFTAAFEQVFGQTVICPNLTVAGQYARSHGLNGVTLDGDRSDRKGAFTGGSIDSRSSRLDAIRRVTRLRDEAEAQKERAEAVKAELRQLDQEIALKVGEVQRVEREGTVLEKRWEEVRDRIKRSGELIAKVSVELEGREAARGRVEDSLARLTEVQGTLEKEVGSAFKKDLTTQEETQLEAIVVGLSDLRKVYVELSERRSHFEAEKSVLEIELHEHLRPRLMQMEGDDALEADGGPVRGQDRHTLATRLNEANKGLEKMKEKLEAVEGKIDVANGKQAECDGRRTEILEEQGRLAREMEKHGKKMEKTIQKRRLLTSQSAEVSARIRELGLLPQSALDKVVKVASEQLLKRLQKVKEGLKKYGHVNKKAFEQYNNFTTQRETLTKRREELDSSQASIEELIQVLDQRKDEAIERTFKQVSREFGLVFEKLVPAGRGRLIIQRKTDAAAVGEESEDEGRRTREKQREKEKGRVESYTGVGISVSFNSKHDDQQRIQQLSGGQKSLCALALVFAIQRCDPAPFYLFDEIDANLDAQYRTAVAQMLQEISSGEGEEGGMSGGQFICTTFRPEMLHVAEKCYGVRYLGNKSSSVVVVDKQEALKFVEGEAVGKAT